MSLTLYIESTWTVFLSVWPFLIISWIHIWSTSTVLLCVSFFSNLWWFFFPYSLYTLYHFLKLYGDSHLILSLLSYSVSVVRVSMRDSQKVLTTFNKSVFKSFVTFEVHLTYMYFGILLVGSVYRILVSVLF